MQNFQFRREVLFDKAAERLCHLHERLGTSEFCSKAMKKFNVGIVGYGWVATAHIPATDALLSCLGSEVTEL